ELVEDAFLHRLRRVDDLAGVDAPMVGRPQEEGEHGLRLAGARLYLEEMRGVEGGARAVRLRDRLVEDAKGLRPREGSPLRELLLSVPLVVRVAHSPAEEVASGAADVEHEVSHRVAARVRPSPDLLVGERIERGPDLRRVAGHHAVSDVFDEG